jgi:hypothetical protein
MPHDDSTEWPRNKSDGKCRVRTKNTGERRNLREELRREYDRGCGTVDEKTVPLNRGADGARKCDSACFYFAIGC